MEEFCFCNTFMRTSQLVLLVIKGYRRGKWFKVQLCHFSLNFAGVLLIKMSLKWHGKGRSSAKIFIYMPCNQFTIQISLLCDGKGPCKNKGNVAKPVCGKQMKEVKLYLKPEKSNPNFSPQHSMVSVYSCWALHGTKYNLAPEGHTNPSGFRNLLLAVITDSIIYSNWNRSRKFSF